MKAEKQSNQLWSVAWVASGFQHTDNLWILAATPEVACRKAMRYLRSQERLTYSEVNE